MFNLFNRVYAGLDYEFTGMHPYNMLSDRLFPVSPIHEAKKGEKVSLESHVQDVYDGDIDKMFKYIYENSERQEKDGDPLAKYILYLTPKDYTRLQIMYYKSIFKEYSEDSLYTIYKLRMEGLKLRLLCKRGIAPRPTEYMKDSEPVSMAEFSELYKECHPISFIRKHVSKEKIGIEYLLADYLSPTPPKYKEELSRRIDKIVWEGIVDILQETMWEMSGHIFSTTRLFDEPINERLNILEQLKKTEQFWWIADDKFCTDDKDYCKELFSKTDFANIINKYLKCGMDASDIEIDRITDRIKLYGKEDPLETLEKDIHTTNTLYNLMSAPSFEGKTNFLFIDFLYETARKKDKKRLKLYNLV